MPSIWLWGGFKMALTGLVVNDNYSFPWRQLLFASGPGVICSSHVGVWSGVCPLGGTESSAPAGADDGGEPKGQTVAFLFPGSRCLAFCARTLSAIVLPLIVLASP